MCGGGGSVCGQDGEDGRVLAPPTSPHLPPTSHLHCSSLAFQPPDELETTLALAREARVTVVSLPLVNQWTQDRAPGGGRTPRWRGVTLLHELRGAGVPAAIASDNTRDQFYAYGDLDMLEVFNQARGGGGGAFMLSCVLCRRVGTWARSPPVARTPGQAPCTPTHAPPCTHSPLHSPPHPRQHHSSPQSCRIAHLDRPYGDWPRAITSTPADAMGLPSHGRIAVGGPADFVICRGRRYSELLSRPQWDGVRGGAREGAACVFALVCVRWVDVAGLPACHARVRACCWAAPPP